MRCRPALLAVLVLLATGCEDQDAVPTSRSTPVAMLQVLCLVAIVGGGWWLLERRARRMPRRVLDEGAGPVAARVLGAVIVSVTALGIVGVASWLIAHGAYGYRQQTNQILSWEETVTYAWWFVSLGGLAALGEVRVAVALVRGAAWAPWVAGAQIALVSCRHWSARASPSSRPRPRLTPGVAGGFPRFDRVRRYPTVA